MGRSALFSGGSGKRFPPVRILTLVVLGLMPLWAGAAEEPLQKSAESFRYDPKDHRDPFVPLVRDGRLVGMAQPSQRDTSKPTLYGILWDPNGRSIALINDGEASVGETVNGYKVVEIRKDAVVLTNGGGPVVLQLVFEEPPKSSRGTTTGGEGP